MSRDSSGVMVMPPGSSPPPPPRKESIAPGEKAKRPYWMIAVGLVAGAALGFVVRPMVSGNKRADDAEAALAASQKDLATKTDLLHVAERTLASEQEKRERIAAELGTAQSTNKELSAKAADVDAKAKQLDDQQKKLQAAVDKSLGSVSAQGDEIHLQLVDKVLFKLNDDQLTDKGKELIDKVAAALKEMPEKQIYVQGHTDDQPIFNPPSPKQPPQKKGQKPVPPPPPRFATNWELSAARALTVVHYLQDTSKIEPSRLAALAFGQYRPVSKQNKAANRRIEIVLYPKVKL